MIDIPWTFATAGLVGLGGLAFLMGAVLSSVAELLTVLSGRRDWAGRDARPLRGHMPRPERTRPGMGALADAVLAWHDGSDGGTARSGNEISRPRAAA